MSMSAAAQVTLIFVTLSGVCLVYLYLLSKRLHGTHPAATPESPFSAEDLDKVSYDDIDMLSAIPSQSTQENYVVIGGSGYLGT